METEKKKRGGARPGAGRKKMINGRNIKMSFSLSSKAANELERQAVENNTTKNDIINILLEKIADEAQLTKDQT